MQSRKGDFTLGVTVIVLLALFVGSFFFITGSALFGPERREIVVHFSLMEGMAPLKRGSPVLLRGALNVGTVTSVDRRLRDEQGRPGVPTIVVRADVDTDITLYRDCRITTSEPVIGGAAFLVIHDVGTPSLGPALADAPIHGERPQSLQAAIGDLSDWLLASDGFLTRLDRHFDEGIEGSVLNKVMASLDDINALTGELRAQMTPQEQQALLGKLLSILDNVHGITASLRNETNPEVRASLVSSVHRALEHLDASLATTRAILSDAQPRLQHTLEHVESAARTVDVDVLAALKAELERDDPTALLGKIHASLDQAQAALTDVAGLAAGGRRMLAANRPALDRTAANLREASEELKTGIAEIRLQPWRITTPPGREEMKRITFFTAARFFAEAAARLDDVAARLEGLSADVPPGATDAEAAAELAELRQSLDTAFTNFRQAEQVFYEKVK
jgi:ABC-type transporter Mla subunit MlaD